MTRHRRSLLKVSGGLLAAGLLSGCLSTFRSGNRSSAGASPAESGVLESEVGRVDPGPDAPVGNLVAGNTAFALDLHRTLADAGPNENRFFSPYSISIALAMTWAGARGTTAREMREVLSFPPQDEVHPAFNALDAEIDGRGEEDDGSDGSDGERAGEEGDDETTDEDDGQPFVLETANSLWGQDGFPFRQEFLDTLARHYGAGLRVVDYESDPAAARTAINEWVAERTEDRIPELFPEGTIDSLTRLVLANAVYFRANWKYTFDEEVTEDREFTALDGTTATVPTMYKSRKLPYLEGDGYQAVELPYVGGDVSMVVVLPDAGTFEAFERDLDAETVRDVFSGLETKDGTLWLPKFTYRSNLKLGGQLAAMGMPSAFDPHTADFHGMYDHGQVGRELFVGSVVHDAYVAVDEEGTEAAAATGVEMQLASAPMDPFEMVVDRPFLFFVRDRPTDAVLFVGRVVDAGAAQD